MTASRNHLAILLEFITVYRIYEHLGALALI
jgi:hypothetical protein